MSRRSLTGLRSDLRRMVSVLAQEHTALLQADFKQLSRLGPRKAALLARLENAPTDSDQASYRLTDQMRAAAARNAVLYESAIAGVRDAHAVIDAARHPPPGRVYGRKGQRQSLDGPSGTLERRA